MLGLIGGNSLEVTELSFGVLSLGDSLASASEDHVEVHTENTSVGIILDSKINMLLDTKSEVTCEAEINLVYEYTNFVENERETQKWIEIDQII